MGKDEPGKNNASEGVPIKKRRFPVFSNDEQFGNNDNGAGVPIKKRGFPVLSPPSPTPQESNLGTGQESSGMDATIVSISVGKFDCSKNPFTEVKRVVSTGSNIDIPNLASQSGVVKSQPASLKCKLEPIANEGSKSKQDCNIEKIVSNDNIASANRSNWDLNTTMDAWGGFSDDAHQLDMGKSNESNKIVGPRLEVGVKVDLGKQNLGDNDGRTEFPNLPLPSTQYRAEDMVHLSHSPTFTLANCVTEPNIPPCSSSSMPFASPANLASCSSACAVSDSVMAVDSELLGQTVSTQNSTSGINVKPEPSEGIAKHDSVAAKVNSVGYKHDLLKMPSGSSSSMDFGLSAVDCSKLPQQDSVAAKVNSEASLAIIKNEVVKSGIAITPNAVEEKQVKPELTSILTESTVKKAVGTVLQSQEIMNSCSSLLPSSPDVSNQGHSAKNTNMPLQGRNNLDMCGGEDSNTFGSDDEKLDISADMIEEDSYGSESESDSHATKRTRGGKEEEDFEDGEIRESLLRNTTLVVATGNGDCENSNLRSSVGLTDNVSLNRNQTKDKDHGGVVGEDQIKECVDANVVERSDNARPAVAEIVSSSLNETQRSEELCHGGDKVTKTETKPTVGETQNDCKKGEIEVSCLRTVDSSLTARQDGARDADSRGGSGRSRIITLSRSSNVESPSKTRLGQESLFEWETRNERCTSLEEDKLQLQRNRGEMLTDGPRRFARDRFQQDQSFRGAIAEFNRGRGRAYDRFDSSEWVSSGRKFKPDDYSGEYRLSRNKHPAAINDELELCKYHLAQADDIIASGRSGRKPLNDEFPSFHNASSRRSSPIVRGPTARRVPVVRRVGRNISPSEEESSDILGNRHSEKYSRNLPPDILDPVYARSQHANEGIDDQRCRKFSQHANEGIDDQHYRKFSFVQRRGIPSRARSKSPTRTRTRSPPGPWSSPPRRRSPDSYNRIRELPRQQRSPPMYRRMERDRSPPLNFPDEFVSRRRGSPPYIARPLNDFERPIMPNQRSLSDRPIPRNNRRFDIPLDSYERPIRSSRFDEIDEEGIGDDRRRLSERRRGRSFNGENLRFHQEGRGPSPLRFAPKGDLQFIERNTSNNNDNTRERTFDRRIKSRPVIAPSRRIRAIEDQEGDFRQGGSAWHDDAFADAAREKRRRF